MMPNTAQAVSNDHARQEVEAGQRSAAAGEGVSAADAELNAGALETGDSDDAGAGGQGQQRQTQRTDDVDVGGTPIRDDQPRRAPSDSIRDSIVANFRKNRSANRTEAAEDVAEIRALARDGIPAELLEGVGEPVAEGDEQPRIEGGVDHQAELETEVDPAAGQQQQPKLHRLVVRGKEQFVTDEQLFEMAQKTAGGDDYLAETRRRLDEVADLQKRLEARASQSGTHPAGESTGTGAAATDTTGDEQPVDPFVGVVEAIQYGDQEAAVDKLKKLFNGVVPVVAKNVSDHDRRAAEHSRSMRVLTEFNEANPDIAKNPMASAAVRAATMNRQYEDLVKVGLDPAKLAVETPERIANLHLTFRADPQYSDRMRTPTAMLKEAREEFVSTFGWKGGAAESGATKPVEQQSQEAAARQPAARIEVNVDRDARRRAIPQQPARTTPLARPAAQEQSKPRSRSDVIRDMQISRTANRARATAQ
jgi:hypothetical protein